MQTDPGLALPVVVEIGRKLHSLITVHDGKLSVQVYQRSADMFLGVPFDLASYALLTHMVAKLTNLEVGEMVYQLGDAHIYNNHEDQAELLLKRASDRPLPTRAYRPDPPGSRSRHRFRRR